MGVGTENGGFCIGMVELIINDTLRMVVVVRWVGDIFDVCSFVGVCWAIDACVCDGGEERTG